MTSATFPHTTSPLLILVAMRDEAAPMLSSLALSPIDPPSATLPTQAFANADRSIILCINGTDPRHNVDLIGTQPATLTTHIAIEAYSPRLIVNAGTAGGFRAHGAAIGDIYLSTDHLCFHDRRIQIPGFDQFGIGAYPTINTDDLAAKLNFKQAILTTGNSIDLPPADLEMMQQYNGTVKDMEAAAIAWVAHLHNVPFLGVKAITDLVDGDKPTHDEFLENLHEASTQLTHAVSSIIPHL